MLGMGGDSQVVLSKEEGCSLPGVGNALVNVGDKVLPDLNKQTRRHIKTEHHSLLNLQATRTCIHTCTHVHTHMHTHVHTHPHTCTNTHTFFLVQ